MSDPQPAGAYVELDPLSDAPSKKERRPRSAAAFDAGDDPNAPVLQVKDLSVEFKTEDGDVLAVQNVSYTLHARTSPSSVSASSSASATRSR